MFLIITMTFTIRDIMLTYDEYVNKYPGTFVYSRWSEHRTKGCELLAEGFLEFDEESARVLSAPWQKKYGMFELVDYSEAYYTHGQEAGFHYLTHQDKYRRKDDWDLWIAAPSVAKPIQMYICGTDDASYSKVYENRDDALFDLNYLISQEPMDFFKEILGRHFHFTN